MPKLEQQNINPIENPREAYEKTEEDEASLKAQLGGAKSADEIMEIATKLKTIEGSKKEVVDIAHEEALKEKEERKMYDEAKAEDEFRSMFDEAKKEDAERTAAKEAEKLNAELENLRGQLLGKTPDEILAIAKNMKELEDKKNEIKIGEEQSKTEKDKESYNKILAGIKEGKIEKIDDIYGLNAEELDKLLESEGYLDEKMDAKDPNFKQQREKFLDQQRKYGQARVKLFDRVLSGEASEEEIKIAENHAKQIAVIGISGFAFAPKSWYTNERLLDAMASASKSSKEWTDYVRNSEYYTKEKLAKGGFEEIGEDGFAHEYCIKGF